MSKFLFNREKFCIILFFSMKPNLFPPTEFFTYVIYFIFYLESLLLIAPSPTLFQNIHIN